LDTNANSVALTRSSERLGWQRDQVTQQRLVAVGKSEGEVARVRGNGRDERSAHEAEVPTPTSTSTSTSPSPVGPAEVISHR